MQHNVNDNVEMQHNVNDNVRQCNTMQHNVNDNATQCMNVLKVAENVFEQYVDTRISSKFLRSPMKARVMKELLSENVFNIRHEHDIEMHYPLEDFHSCQVSKAIVAEYFKLRQPGQDVTANIKMQNE